MSLSSPYQRNPARPERGTAGKSRRDVPFDGRAVQLAACSARHPVARCCTERLSQKTRSCGCHRWRYTKRASVLCAKAGEELVALVRRQVQNPGRKVLVDEQRGSAGFRVHPHDRVHRGWHLGDLVGAEIGTEPVPMLELGVRFRYECSARRPRRRCRMSSGRVCHARCWLAKSVSPPSIGNSCACRSDPILGRALYETIRVPEHARIAEARRTAVRDHVRHDQDLGMARQRELVQDVAFERAPPAAEGHLLRRGDLLVTEHQHVVSRCASCRRAKAAGDSPPAMSRRRTSAPSGPSTGSMLNSASTDRRAGSIIDRCAWRAVRRWWCLPASPSAPGIGQSPRWP